MLIPLLSLRIIPVSAESQFEPPEFIEISSPEPEDEDRVFRSGLEIEIADDVTMRDSASPRISDVRRSRIKSRQEEMEGLEGLSEIAEQVMRLVGILGSLDH